jgi:hypothetical protein
MSRARKNKATAAIAPAAMLTPSCRAQLERLIRHAYQSAGTIELQGNPSSTRPRADIALYVVGYLAGSAGLDVASMNRLYEDLEAKAREVGS